MSEATHLQLVVERCLENKLWARQHFTYCGPPPPIFILTDGMALPWRRGDGGQVPGPMSRGQGVRPHMWLTRSVVLWLVYATDNFSLHNIGFFKTIYGVLVLLFFMLMVIKWCLWISVSICCIYMTSCFGHSVWYGLQQGVNWFPGGLLINHIIQM